MRDARDASAVGAAFFFVLATVLCLWLAGGVQVDEIARYVSYEIGFVFLPGWLVYRALVSARRGRLEEVVLGWSLGYLLEILAFFATAATDARSAFYAYPLVVGIPATLVVWRRRVATPAPNVRARLPLRAIWIGAVLCALLLLYAGAVGFTQTPLPRDTSTVTYQEDTVFTISLAAEALHHWPMTLPTVAGQELHYHLFAYMHMAAISQVTGIDLSVVVMRLYEVPLLLLFALLLIVAGRRLGGTASAGLAACFVVAFLGELDMSADTGVGRFLFRDLFFFWLVASHNFLLGLVFFLAAVLVLSDLVGREGARERSRVAPWILLAAYLIGSVGSKSYSLIVVGGALVLFLLWKLWRARTVHQPALAALGVSVAVYVAANIVVFGWNSAGALVRPLRNIETMTGVESLGEYLDDLWGTVGVPTGGLGVAYATFGLLGVPILGIGLLLKYKRLSLSDPEALFLSFFVAVLPTFFLFNQPGFGQMFLVFFGVVPGLILAACGYLLFWQREARRSLRSAVLILASVGVSVLVLDAMLQVSASVGLQVTLFVVVVAATVGAGVRMLSPRLALPVAAGVGVFGLLVLDLPFVHLLRSSTSDPIGFPLGTAAAIAFALGVAGLAAGTLYVARRGSARRGIVTAAVAGTVVLGILNTPLDWFPHLAERVSEGEPVYNQEYSGLTAGLHAGLTWIRDQTDADAVLVVNNHSIHPDGRDSKYFYYSAFAERRVVLESWDYTENTTRRGYFSLPAEATPFPRRLALSTAVFRKGNEEAMRVLARRYGATHVVEDKVHGGASDAFTRLFPAVFSNEDVGVYAVGRPGHWLCRSEQKAGIAAVFGHRRTSAAADELRSAAETVGFTGLENQRRGCFNYAVVLTGIRDLAQAHEFRREAATVGFHVRLECRSHAPRGGLNAVFGHRRTKRAAEQLATRAQAAGFEGLVVQQDACGDWEVDLTGLESIERPGEFRRQAESVGFRISFEPG